MVVFSIGDELGLNQIVCMLVPHRGGYAGAKFGKSMDISVLCMLVLSNLPGVIYPSVLEWVADMVNMLVVESDGADTFDEREDLTSVNI